MNTMQQEFDAVVAHLYKQGKPARTASHEGPGCYYRTPGTNLMCAVGCRIPDAAYVPEMDVANNGSGTGVTNLIKRFGDVLPPEIKAYKAMFSRLQDIHDGAETVEDDKFDFENLGVQLEQTAKLLGLTFTKPQGA